MILRIKGHVACADVVSVPRATREEFGSLYPTIPSWRTEATPINGNYQDLPLTCDIKNVVSHLLALIIALVGLAGNGVVLWLLGFRMHRNTFFVYLLNLAAADSLFLCCHSTGSLAMLSIFPHTPPLMYDIIENVKVISYIAGLGLLSTISTECSLSVLWPIWYRCHRPKHTSAVMCVLLWTISVLLDILKWCFCSSAYDNFEHDRCKKVEFFIAVWLMFSFLILSGSSLALLSRICGSRQMRFTRLYVIILLSVLVFLLCGLPFGIFQFLILWIEYNINALSCLYVVIAVLSSVNSCANPIIYFFVGSFRQQLQRQQTFRLVLQRALQDTSEEHERGNSNLQRRLEMLGKRGTVMRSPCPAPSSVSMKVNPALPT
ncbi:mas-related G-protein coupled receptor member X2-like [Marmota flaviventris]|uniref:mas-related G-protein coupled receptor member X2-like n=1 Tax=Marmota flaviventris TaxID=93162 RepID=UPI003A8637AA